MFSIEFCVCFYSTLYVCHCHFTGNIFENCTQKYEIKMTTNLNLRNRHEAIISQNNTTAQYLTKNISKIYVDTDIRGKGDSPITKKSTEKYEPTNNIDKDVIKKNYSIFGIEFTLYDLGKKKQLVTKKMIHSDDYLENTIDSRNQRELIEGTGPLVILKNDTDEEHSTILKIGNITKNVTNISRIYGMDTNALRYDLPKNFENNNKTKSIRKYESPNNLKPQSEDTGESTISKNDIIVEKSTVITNENVTEIVTNIIQNNSMGKDVEKHYSSKNVQKRDIGIPENVPNNYTPEVFQNHNAKNNHLHELHKKMENYDKPKNTIHNFNDVKPYNYQNDQMNYKNIINKKYVIKKDKHARRYDDNISHNFRPQLQTILNNDLVKKSLDEFKMVRRKTHYTLPDVELKTDLDKHDIYRYEDLAYRDFPGARNHVQSDYYVEDIQNNMYPTSGELNHIYQSAEGQDDIDNFKELNKIIARQKKIIKKLEKLQTRPTTRSTTKLPDFDVLISEVEAKQKMQRKWRNYTDFTFVTTTTTTTTGKPTTILTLFDETAVRVALKNDPHVKRILKMANLKREKYLNNVRRHLTRNNYTHDTKYAKNLAESANVQRIEAKETTAFVNSI